MDIEFKDVTPDEIRELVDALKAAAGARSSPITEHYSIAYA